MSNEVATRALSRVIVTGAGGFLGSALSDRLEREGVDVIRLGRGNGFRLLEDELPINGVDHVFHLAAETGVPDAWNDPARFHLVNTHGTVRVLDQCRRAEVSMTYAGAYIYGAPRYLPIDEQHPVDANNPYAFSKRMAEEAAQWYAQLYGMSVTAIRLFNVYGPGQSERFLIPSIVSQVCDPRVEQIELMDLAPRRDYLFVDDAVDALVASVPRSGFQLYNVGSGHSHSVRDVVVAAQELAGVEKPVLDHGRTRPNEIADVVCDHARITAETGWAPRVDLRKGLELMIQEEMS
jgi:nucleoside-diphosphate-sugar epimerase